MGFPERLPRYREPPARRQKRYAVRLSMSLFKIHVTSPDFKKRCTDRHFCTIGTTNAVLDYSLCGGDILADMNEDQNRTARDVLEDHLQQAREGTLEDDLAQNYALDAVFLSSRGIYRGHDGLRQLNTMLQEDLPRATYEYRNQLVDGEMAFLEWTARSERAAVEDGADSYLIRDGRIVAQTIHYTVKKLS
jgi:hypothetical protein